MSWNRHRSFSFGYSVKILLITVVVAIVLRAMFVSAFVIQTNSMRPTLRSGDFIIGWKAFVPQRGDIVVLPCPQNESNTCIKRVIGIPGDRVEIHQQHLVVNTVPAHYSGSGDELHETWQDHGWNISLVKMAASSTAAIMVPPEHVFLLNDNRDEAGDSRDWGPVPMTSVEAKAWRIWMSIDWAQNKILWRRLLRRID